jgi:valyl-tRNA synthetase
MKAFVLFLFLSIVLFNFGIAQKKDLQPKGVAVDQLVIRENMQLLNSESKNALILGLPNADAKKAESVWQGYVKQFKASSTKKDRKSGIYFSDDANLSKISNNTLDLYARFEDGNNGTVATVWFDLGGAYLASETHSDAYQQAEAMLKDFAIAVNRSLAEDNVVEQEKIQKNLEKELDKLQKDNKKYNDKIEEAKKVIAEMEASILQNEKDQENKQTEIENQKKEVEKAKAKVKEF